RGCVSGPPALWSVDGQVVTLAPLPKGQLFDGLVAGEGVDVVPSGVLFGQLFGGRVGDVDAAPDDRELSDGQVVNHEQFDVTAQYFPRGFQPRDCFVQSHVVSPLAV